MADIKKFLDQAGVSTLWSRITTKISEDVKSEADRAKLAEEKIAKDLGNLSELVGVLPEGTTAKDVVDYINIKTAGIATDAALGELQNQLNGVQGEVSTIKGDYLKSTDKTELSDAITAEANRAKGIEGGLETRLATVEGDYLKGADKTELQGNIDTVTEKVTTLIGEDSNKSVRTIANEELAKQLVAEGAAESLDTLAEIAAWIQSHPGDAAAMNEAITALQNKVDTGDKTVSAYVTAAISALSIGDYAKAADLTALAGRVSAIEADYLKAADKTALNEAISLKADQTTLNEVKSTADAAATKTYVDTELNKKALQSDLEAEVTARQNAVTANADAIVAIKKDATIVTFAGIEAELAKKQNTIPANTYDIYGSASQAESNANTYTNTQFAKIQSLSTTDIDAAIASAQV